MRLVCPHDFQTNFAYDAAGNSQESWMQTTVSGPGTIRFWWKVSSEAYYDWLEFRVDGVQQDSISGEVDWTETSYAVTGTGNHTLKWRYAKDGSGSDGEDCAYVDYVQWTGPLAPGPADRRLAGVDVRLRCFRPPDRKTL